MTSIRNLAAGVLGAVGAYKTLNATLGEAARMELAQISVGALFKEDKKSADEFFTFLNKSAKDSFFGQKDFFTAGKMFVPMTKNLDTLEQATKLAERLGASNMDQGMEGAAYAMREMLSGDFVSLQERFNMSRGDIKKYIKDQTTIEGKLKGLDQLLTNMGYNQNYLNSVNDTAYAKWLKLGDTAKLALAGMGKSALEKAKPALDQLALLFESPAFKDFGKAMSDGMAAAAGKVVEFVNYIVNNRESVAGFLKSAADGFKSVYDKALQAGTWIKDNWPLVRESIIALTAAVVAAKVGFAALKIVQTITAMMAAYRTVTATAAVAQGGLSAAMALFPGTWIVAAIAGVIAAGVLLYRNWDTVAAKMDGAWQWIKNSASTALNFVIGKINDMIGLINKIPGVNVPIIPKIDTSPLKAVKVTKKDTSASMNDARKGLYSGHGHHGGLSRVYKNGYHARLHKDEMVLNKVEADEYRKNKGNGGGLTINIENMNVRKESDIDAIAKSLAKKMALAAGGI
ncbi:MAG: hypothetical protein ACQET8_02145 [Bacillota bacterium]